MTITYSPTASPRNRRYARKLQRLWRGFYARKVRDVKLFDRETMAREQVVAELASEATYALEKWQGLSRTYAKQQFEARIEDLSGKEAALQKVRQRMHEWKQGRDWKWSRVYSHLSICAA
jgi:hypothetical protein